jgi:hypothetical protein
MVDDAAAILDADPDTLVAAVITAVVRVLAFPTTAADLQNTADNCSYPVVIQLVDAIHLM